ncbi:cell wall metabolism sensor histidine kinase WalK, partial [Klebsiella pneumoniae]|uniref:histidine kinase dimerization/phospho-acceptor domain-containing protein n=1 Tax=Klebsiella pneumoniae TaxID=573 RepID=UPI002005FBE5
RGVVALWNRAAETITGIAEADVVGRPVSDAIPGWAVIADRVPVTQLPYSGSVSFQTLPLAIEHAHHAHGSDLWISISGVQFPEGTVYAFRDVSDVRAIERMKSDFVATVSHELRTPLASVYGAAVTLQRTDLQVDAAARGQLL